MSVIAGYWSIYLGAFCLYCLALALLFPLGHLISLVSLRDVHWRLQVLAAFGFSSAIYAILILLLFFFGASGETIQRALLSVLLVSLVVWIQRQAYRELEFLESLFLLAVTFGYLCLTLVISAFPDGALASGNWSNTQRLTNLPIDGLISYNVARYLMDGIAPSLVEVVPGWELGDRAPLGGVLAAGFLSLVGVSDSGHWLRPAPAPYFVYQGFLSFLNLLAFPALWVLGVECFSKRAAATSLLLVGSTYFWMLNFVYPWPKAYAAFYVILVLLLWRSGTRPWILGLFLAMGALAHSVALLNGVVFLGALLVLALRKRSREWIGRQAGRTSFSLWESIVFTLSFAFFYSPWALYKKFVLESSPRMLYFHLFCQTAPAAKSRGLKEALAVYLETTSYSDMLSVRLDNLLLHFNPIPVLEALNGSHSSLFAALNALGALSFTHYLTAVGPFVLLLFLAAVFYCRKDAFLLLCLFTAFGVLLPFAAIEGCPFGNANHLWAYSALLLTALLAASTIERWGTLGNLCFALAIVLNLLSSALYLFYHSFQRPMLHASPKYFVVVGVTAALWIGLIVLMAAFSSEEDVSRREG